MYEQNFAEVRPAYGSDFYSKVYFCFGLAVAVSAAGAYLGLNYLTSYFLSSPGLIYVLFIAELALILTSRMWSQRTPLNYLLFSAFALITGLTLVPILAYITVTGGIGLVIKALASTALMFTASAIFGATTRFNLQGLRGFLTMSIIGMIVVSLVGIFIPWGNTFEMIFSGFGVVLFSGYVMFDIQRLKAYPENMYIDAALQLYLDIFNLFLYILRLLMALNRR
jgi:hypothetical protein